MIISIEGMDGTGKSTIAREVAKRVNFYYLEKAFQEFFNISKEEYLRMCENIDKLDDNTKALFYGLSNILVSKLNHKNLIIDKHILSTYFHNKTNSNEELFDILTNFNVNPDLTIVLYASIESRETHLKRRNKLDKDLFDKKKMSFGYDVMMEYVNKYNLKYLFINTDNYEYIKDLIDKISNVIICMKNMETLEFDKLLEEINNKELNNDEELKTKIYKRQF